MIEIEGWETLTADDLHSRDPSTVARIEALLHAALGRSGQNRECREQRRALAKLNECTIARIRKVCSNGLRTPIDSPDVTALADQIFASHAWGAPFLNNDTYQTWHDTWESQKQHFAALVRITARDRCKDWYRSPQSHNGPRKLREHPPEDDDGNVAGMDFFPSKDIQQDTALEWAQSLQRWQTAVNLLDEPYKSALRARFGGYTVAEYAEQQGVNATAAHNHFERGLKKLIDLVKNGKLDVDFGSINGLTPPNLIERRKKRLPGGIVVKSIRPHSISPYTKKESGDDDTL